MDCSICYGEFNNPVRLECQHQFCSGCLLQWMTRSQSCPLCRGQIVIIPRMNPLPLFLGAVMSIGMFVPLYVKLGNATINLTANYQITKRSYLLMFNLYLISSMPILQCRFVYLVISSCWLYCCSSDWQSLIVLLCPGLQGLCYVVDSYPFLGSYLFRHIWMVLSLLIVLLDTITSAPTHVVYTLITKLVLGCSILAIWVFIPTVDASPNRDHITVFQYRPYYVSLVLFVAVLYVSLVNVIPSLLILLSCIIEFKMWILQSKRDGFYFTYQFLMGILVMLHSLLTIHFISFRDPVTIPAALGMTCAMIRKINKSNGI